MGLELGMVGQRGRVAMIGSQKALRTAAARKEGLTEKQCRGEYLSCCDKHHHQSSLREESVCLVYTARLQCIVDRSHVTNTSRNSSRHCGGRLLTALLPLPFPASSF